MPAFRPRVRARADITCGHHPQAVHGWPLHVFRQGRCLFVLIDWERPLTACDPRGRARPQNQHKCLKLQKTHLSLFDIVDITCDMHPIIRVHAVSICMMPVCVYLQEFCNLLGAPRPPANHESHRTVAQCLFSDGLCLAQPVQPKDVRVEQYIKALSSSFLCRAHLDRLCSFCPDPCPIS